jgi:hypothetical protein
MPTKKLKPTRLQAIDWIDAQLLKPTDRFILKPGHYINDLNECLRTQKMRILFGGDLEAGLAYRKVKQIKDYLNLKK